MNTSWLKKKKLQSFYMIKDFIIIKNAYYT